MACSPGSGGDFLGLPTWYKYLDGETKEGLTGPSCLPVVNEFSDVWLIALAVFEILIRVGVYLSIGYIIYGGIRMIMAQGNSEALQGARNTILNAIIGLLVTVSAATLVGFIGKIIT